MSPTYLALGSESEYDISCAAEAVQLFDVDVHYRRAVLGI